MQYVAQTGVAYPWNSERDLMATMLTGNSLRRHVRRAGRRIYFRLPPRWRDVVVDIAFSRAGPLFRGFPAYEAWRQQRVDRARYTIDVAGRFTELRDIDPLPVSPGRIAVHAHVYYSDLAAEVAEHLRLMPFEYDLFVSVTSEEGRRACERAFRGLPLVGALRIETVPNRGRDIAPMLCAFAPALRDYDYLAHIHTKKSLYSKGATAGWREYLLNALLGDERYIRSILSLLNQGVGLIYPQNYHRVPYAGNTWMANFASGRDWCARLGVRCTPRGYFDFPTGSMFWARVDALLPLWDANLTPDDFDEEKGQNDGTLAHVVERLFGILVRDSGRDIVILRDTRYPSWSPWHLEQYLLRRQHVSEARVTDPDVRLVVFDIFDTLLTRPLIDPEQIKAIVARNAGELGQGYLRWRGEAEQSAREQAGRDVGLTTIMAELGRLAGLDAEAVGHLHDLEVAAETACVAARPDVLTLFQLAVSSGKRVALAADSCLSASVVEAMLSQKGFTGWHRVYLSGEIGLRKDSGALYTHILRAEGIEPQQAIVVGDNEHADLQVPGGAGWNCLHVMRPVELGRALHRLAPLIEDIECGGTADTHLAMGLVVRGIFGKLHYEDGFDAASMIPEPDAENLGYAIAGPLVFAFAQWLIDQASADGVERLYFLSREGQFLKMVYDRVARTVPNAPASSYLVVSRRALNVPSVKTLDDAMAIAKAHYGPAPLEGFLWERFGLRLDPDNRRKLGARDIWEEGQLLEVSVRVNGVSRELLEALLPAILAQAERERPPIMAYLQQMGLGQGRHAVVDVGFSGTIQRGLNALIGGGLDGYYMATLANAQAMERQHGVRALGAYCHHAPLNDVPAFIRNGFILEKLLSADDAQVMYYRLDADGVPTPEFRGLSDAERAVFPLRAEIRGGALDFVDEAVAAREHLLSDFRFPLDVAGRLFETFADKLSPGESEAMRGVVLDDHYCGRGLVN